VTDARRISLVVGRFSSAIGGPYQTVLAYRDALSSQGHDVAVRAMAAPASGEEPDVDEVMADGPRFAWHLLRLAWRTRSELVVVFGVWHPMFLAVALPRFLFGRRGVPGRRVLVPTNSLSAWDWAKHARVKTALRPLVTLLLSGFDAVVFSTRGEMATSKPRLSNDRALVAYHPSRYSPKASGEVPQPTARIVFCGRIVVQKDLPLFLEAFAALPEHFRADVVGDGEPALVAAARTVADELGISERITWHSWLTRDDVWRVMESATALVVTSREENYCHAAVEAMALGVPVVCVGRVAAAVDMAQLGTALIAHPNPEALRDAVLLLDEDQVTRGDLVDSGRRFAHSRFGDGAWKETERVVVGGGR
jgi:glycosyltransferase involved in cell wall biosynthesis